MNGLRDRMIGFRIARAILKPIFKFWYNPVIIYEGNIPEENAVVIACNHKHIMDQCLIISATKRPINYMAKAEYFKGKFAWFFRMSGCICVNRNGSDEQAKQEANRVLRRRGAIGIFPEGTRNKTDNLVMDFKYGAASLACKNSAVIVPVAVTGEYKFRSKTLVARIGTPFSTEGMGVAEARDKLYNEIVILIMENLGEGYGTQQEYEKARRFNEVSMSTTAV